jgi:Fur family ferric uptake transcriptional regulator
VISDELLRTHSLSRTNIREEILDVFLEEQQALSMHELKQKMNTQCDRVTLYRNLKKFTQVGILHEVYLDKQDSKYIIPENIVNPQKEYSEHLHFKCVHCELVQCLTDQEITSVQLPKGFKKLEANFVVYGICPKCNTD